MLFIFCSVQLSFASVHQNDDLISIDCSFLSLLPPHHLLLLVTALLPHQFLYPFFYLRVQRFISLPSLFLWSDASCFLSGQPSTLDHLAVIVSSVKWKPLLEMLLMICGEINSYCKVKFRIRTSKFCSSVPFAVENHLTSSLTHFIICRQQFY